MLLVDELRIGAVVRAHSWNDLVSYAHAACIHVAVVTHDVDQRLVASIAQTGLHSLWSNGVGKASWARDLKSVREDGQHDVGSRYAVVAVNDRVDDGFAHNRFRVLPAVHSARSLETG